MDEDQNVIMQQELEEIVDALCENVLPIVDELETEYPDHSVWFSLFVQCLHEMFHQGFTKEELLSEVECHHEIFLQEEMSSKGEVLH